MNINFPINRSCPLPSEKTYCGWDDYSNNSDNPHILHGALVGGPNQNDGYSDVRSDFQSNEVTTDYNAGFTRALAGKIPSPSSARLYMLVRGLRGLTENTCVKVEM